MERIDDLQLGGLKIIQDDALFCFGVDAVLLSHFAKDTPAKTAVDLCSGNGIVAILLAGKTNIEKLMCVEVQPKAAELARRSVALNSLEDRISVIEDNLNNCSRYFAKASVDVVTCNPPYIADQGGLKNKTDEKNIARHEILCTLEDVIRESADILKSGGKLFMVHKPERLVDIFCTMRKYRIEPKRVQFVHPQPHKKANIVLVEGVRSGGAELKMMPPLYVYDENHNYSKEINEIYGREHSDV